MGGLYGVHLGAAFMAESKFSLPEFGGTDASKVVLIETVQSLQAAGFELFDVQFRNDHIDQFGVAEITADEYEQRLAAAMVHPRDWPVDADGERLLPGWCANAPSGRSRSTAVLARGPSRRRWHSDHLGRPRGLSGSPLVLAGSAKCNVLTAGRLRCSCEMYWHVREWTHLGSRPSDRCKRTHGRSRAHALTRTLARSHAKT